MSNNHPNLKLRPSKNYLGISIFIYGLCLLLPWWRLDSIWLNIVLTVAIGFSAMAFFSKYVLLSKAASITSISLGKGHVSISSKDGETHLYSTYVVSYQSRVLVIIRFGKTYVPIFKDSLQENNLSSLNRFINVG